MDNQSPCQETEEGETRTALQDLDFRVRRQQLRLFRRREKFSFHKKGGVGEVVFQEGAFPHVAITCNKAEIIRAKSVIMIQNQPSRMEKAKKKKKRSRKDLCQDRPIKAVSQVTDHVFGIL